MLPDGPEYAPRVRQAYLPSLAESMKLADTFIDPQAGALLAQDAIAEWLDRYRLELDSQTEQIIYEGIIDALKRADLIELK